MVPLLAYLINPGFIWLGVAAAAPIIVHLIARRRYKIVELPTVRFIFASAKRSTRRKNLRYLLLLLLRILTILAMVLVIARPTLRPTTAAAGPRTEQAAPIILLLDDSFSMNYRSGGRRVFEAARASALEVLDQVHPKTSVLLLSSSRPAAGYWMDVDRVRQDLLEERPVGTAGDMWTIMRRCADAVENEKLARAEVFCFTDLTVGAWPNIGEQRIDLGENTDLYVIDVGADTPVNTGVVRLESIGGPIFAGSIAQLRAEIASFGGTRETYAELALNGNKQAQEPIALESGARRNLYFSARLPEAGTHVLRLRLNQPDELPEDDRRYFVVESPPALEVLLVGPADVAPEAPVSPTFFLKIALEPYGRGGAGFRVRQTAVDQINLRELDELDVVYLVGVRHVPEPLWESLRRFVVRGGGLGVFLPPKADIDSYNTEAARKVLPARVQDAVTAEREPLRLRVLAAQHPVIRRIRSDEGIDLAEPRLVRAYRLRPDSAAETLLSLGPKMPALIEKRLGGRVLMFASSADDAWGDLPRTNLFLPFTHEMTLFLAGRTGGRIRNFRLGERVPVRYDKTAVGTQVFVQAPGQAEWEELLEAATPGVVYYWHTFEPGLYRVRVVHGEKERRTAFAVNPPPGESNVERVNEEALREAVSAAKVVFSKKRKGIASQIHETRTRSELTPWIVLALLLLLGAESYLANRFYPVQTS